MSGIEISVIIPVYNNPSVVEAIKSVLNQDINIDYEIIVVDDGSKDNTLKILQEFKQHNNLDKLSIIVQNNSGPAAARNRGISESRGKYIAFLDSDDCWDQGKLSAQMELFKSDPDIKLVSTQLNNRRFKKFNDIQTVEFKSLLFHNYIYTSTVIVEKMVLDEVGYFNANQKYSEDYDLWLRIAQKYKCVVINKSFVTYGGGKAMFGASGLTKKLWAMEKGELSNYNRLLKNRGINLIEYISSIIYSLVKYMFRRIIITIGRNK